MARTDTSKAGGTATAGIESMSYEQARAELIEVVQRLESGNQTLEESLATWERGEALARRCQEWLDGARERLAHAKAEREGGAADDGAPGDGAADDGAADNADDGASKAKA